ncbi:MAG TPA: AAA family ATPase [Kouleothrix sp.]|uniref:AAA family ATPase n=1 Tax=Kouleothrix sp. TaxID=2779161 RepID=UPI002BA53093|nr:AAA family ATPase [Kouleothrix sp.]HRC74536.1 AAA family ATPase [Kouleothrix sp.]
MALEPYSPPSDQRYRDDLDREIDQKIDKMLERWPSKTWRLIRRTILIVVGIYLYWNYVAPSVTAWVSQGNPVLDALMFAFQMALTIALAIIQFVAIFWFLGRGRTYWVKPGETGVSFKDYRGNPEVLEAARRIVTLLKGAKEFKDMGGEAVRGLLLVGPPGTGKSYLAQAISTEAGVPFGYASAPSFQNMFVGVGPLRVRMLYSKARKLAKEYGACILFIDEIDAIGGARSSSMAGGMMGMGGGMMGNMMGAGILNELLLQMDPPPQEVKWWRKTLRNLGLIQKKVDMPAVLTMGATNLVETLDQALLRPGRFDRKIVVDRPDGDGRKEIIEYYLSKVKHEPMPMDRMVSDTIGYTPVAIKYVINEAVIHAHFDGRLAINYWDFTAAREVHEWGLKQPIRNLAYEERRATAYHEAGHAYLQAKLIKRERISKVTIVRHGQAAGFVGSKPLDEHHIPNKQEILDDITVTLGAFAAEETFLGYTTAGVSMDMIQATDAATRMVGYWAMDDSFFSYGAMGGIATGEIKPRVERILDQQYRVAKRLLEANKEAVIAIAEALILRNELTDIDVNEILARVEAAHPFTDPRAIEARPFGLLGTRPLPEPTSIRRNGRNGNGKAHEPLPEVTIPAASQAPADPYAPTGAIEAAPDDPQP